MGAVVSAHCHVAPADRISTGRPKRGSGVNALRAKNRSFLVITHYQRLLDHIVPDTVHVMSQGRIVRTGGKELALELEKSGYASYGEAA